MFACELLARIGYNYLVDRLPKSDQSDMSAIRERLAYSPVAPQQNREGANWILPITWPDRMPRLKTWAGQTTLPYLIKKSQKALSQSDVIDPFEVQMSMLGASGIDGLTAGDAQDIGFSPNALKIPTSQRVGIELLAIVGAETVPLVSLGGRWCGFLSPDHTLYRFPVEPRDGGYLFRWGHLYVVSPADDSWPTMSPWANDKVFDDE